MFKLARSYVASASCELQGDSLISVVCQCSMITAFTGNMAEEVFNVLIVLLLFFLSIGSGTGIVLKVPV